MVGAENREHILSKCPLTLYTWCGMGVHLCVCVCVKVGIAALFCLRIDLQGGSKETEDLKTFPGELKVFCREEQYHLRHQGQND